MTTHDAHQPLHPHTHTHARAESKKNLEVKLRNSIQNIKPW